MAAKCIHTLYQVPVYAIPTQLVVVMVAVAMVVAVVVLIMFHHVTLILTNLNITQAIIMGVFHTHIVGVYIATHCQAKG
jgi:hypothetical protein